MFDQYALIARTAVLLGVSGRLQVQEPVVHLIAESLWIPALPQPIDVVPSRDFH